MEEKFREIVVSMPLYVEMGVKKIKRFHFNLNQYRNWHYQVNNNLKIKYKEIVYPQIEGQSFEKIKLEFTHYKASKRKVDRSNVLSIHEKFFCDALVESGCLVDDNDDYLESSHYYSGGIDRKNPRVEIRVIEVSHGI